ncbi:MAG: sialidase family protein [Anaerolineae bacterium]
MIRSWQYIRTPDQHYPTCHAANLAILTNGQLAVVYFAGTREGSSDSVNLLQRLQADGVWSQPEVAALEAGRSAGNAVLMPVPDGRTILFYTLSYGREVVTWADALIHYCVSEDNCHTWGPRRIITEEFGYICRQPGLILSNGEWLLPIYDNRGGGNPAFAGMGGNEGSVIISSDAGQHWSRYGRMLADAGTAQPCVIELEPGHLRAWLRTRNYWNGINTEWACLYRSESFDYGRNWSRPERTTIPNNNSSFQVIRLQSRALLMAYNHQTENTRSPLNMALSYDDGETWPVRCELEPFDRKGGEYSYPVIAQSPTGQIHVAYTYHRTHLKHITCDQAWIEAESL